jgi:hypothetical protein
LKSLAINENTHINESIENVNNLKVVIGIFPCLGMTSCSNMPKINIDDINISNNELKLDNIFNFG